MTNEREVRVATEVWPTADLEIRAEGDGMTFSGYAAVFESNSEPMPFIERIAPGAFSRSLKRDRNLRMFLNHNTDTVLATTKAGTLRLSEDDKGLKVDADLPDTSAGRDLATLMKRGDVDSMSFGFVPVRETWVGDPYAKDSVRTLTEVRLFEVSPVTGWPAYPATSASVRELADELGVEPEPLIAAFRILTTPDERLTTEQSALLLSAINARTDTPFVSANVATWRSKLAAKGITD